MKREAVEQARRRLSQAQKAVDKLIAATNYADAEDAWIDFLVASSAVYSKLEQGAKGNSKSDPWFGKKKNERKIDPLLSYLHHARNSSEHGIERTVGQTPPNTDGFGQPLKFNERTDLFKWQSRDPVTKEILSEGEGLFAGPTLKPSQVTDSRFGDTFDPPRTHLGKEIVFCDFADGLAKQAIIYLESLVSEAESLL